MRSRSVAGVAVLGIALSLLLAGCPRNPPGEPDAGTDASVDAHVSNAFEGAIHFDDARMQRLTAADFDVPAGACREPFLAEVTRVSDGDTIHVRGITAVVDAQVRLTGVNTPETGTCYASEATFFTEQLIGHLVWIVYDQECFDRFDRLLGYVYIGDEEGDFWQRQLMRRGYAVELSIAPNTHFESVFAADEAFAMGENRGLWQACP